MTHLPAEVPATDEGPLARLFAGGLHVRMLVLGRPPEGLTLPPFDRFERVAPVVTRDAAVPGTVVADPLRLPFIEALFDRALVTSLLPEDQARAELREVWRVLSPAATAVLAVKARRRWQVHAEGWRRATLEPLLGEAMFEVLDWRTETLAERWHLVFVGKVDGLRPALIGRVDEVLATAPAT